MRRAPRGGRGEGTEEGGGGGGGGREGWEVGGRREEGEGKWEGKGKGEGEGEGGGGVWRLGWLHPRPQSFRPLREAPHRKAAAGEAGAFLAKSS